MSNLLNKFECVEIKNLESLSPDDKDFCKKQQDLYEKTLKYCKEIHDKIAEVFKFQNAYAESVKEQNMYTIDGYKHYYYGFNLFKPNNNTVFDDIKKLHNKHIDNIINYFKTKYNIDIENKQIEDFFGEEPELRYAYISSCQKNKSRQDYDDYCNKMVDSVLSYEQVLDYIFEYLGGFNFQEKTDKEIRERCLNAVTTKWNNTTYYNVKNSKITFDCLTSSNKCRFLHKYEINLNGDNYKSVLTALSYFDSNGQVLNINQHIKNKFVCYKKYEDDGIYAEHNLVMNKIKSIKYYKNGKFEVNFISHQETLNFAKDFLNYHE